MKKNNTEVMEVEAEEMLPEMELEKIIDKSLVKANITDQVLAALNEKYKDVRLKDINDKESFLECKAASKEIRKVEIIIEKTCEMGRSEAVKVQRMWISKQKSLLAKTAETKEPIDDDIKKFEDEIARKENEEKQKREEAFIARQASLLKYGAEYKNGNYELGEISYEIELIKNSDTEVWDEVILPKYKRVYEQKEAARVEEETKKKAEADRLKAEQDKLEEDRRIFKEQKDLFEKQKKDLEDKKTEQEKKQKDEQEKIQAEHRRKKNEMLDNRMNQLRALGMTFNFTYDAFVFEDVNVDNKTEICLFNEKEWEDLIAKITPAIEERKIEKEKLEKRVQAGKARFGILKDMGFYNEDEVNLSTLTDEHWQSMYAGYKKTYDDKKKKEWEDQQALKKKLEDEQKQKELDAANDKTKYADVVKYLSACPTYEMKSSLYKSKMSIIKDFIVDLKEN